MDHSLNFGTRLPALLTGSGITASDHEGVTPFALGQYNAAIAFDEEHCIEVRKSLKSSYYYETE